MPDTRETISFTDAKSHLSSLMDKVVHRGEVKIVDRHHGKEEMALLGLPFLLDVMAGFEFHPVSSVVDGEFVLRLPELGLVSGGATLDEAVDEMVEIARAYSDQYLNRWEFYAQAGRGRHLPWAFRLSLITDQALREMLVAPPASAGQSAIA